MQNNNNHETIKHSAGEYCRNDKRKAFKIHTNSIEGFWSLLKRGIIGQFHKVSKQYLNDYLNEFEFRYNRRNANESCVFDELMNKMLRLA